MFFGPQLIGQVEKTLNAILGHVLDGTGLTERQWVTLKLAAASAPSADLVGEVRTRAHFADADALVADLAERGLVTASPGNAGLTAAGAQFLSRLQEQVATTTAPIWTDLPESDVAAAERVLTEVHARSRAVLSSL